MFILKKGHQPGVYVPLRALFLVFNVADKGRKLSFNYHQISSNTHLISSSADSNKAASRLGCYSIFIFRKHNS